MAPKPLAICIEDVSSVDDTVRYLQCVAIPGDSPGLAIDDRGVVRWKAELDRASEIFVSADDRLILFRRQGAAEIVLRRAGRSLDVPVEKPVVLLDQDRAEIHGRVLRIHVHGTAPHLEAPSYYKPEPLATGSGAKAAAAAALALGVAMGLGGCKRAEADDRGNGYHTQPIEVRAEPPKVLPPKKPPDGGPEQPPTQDPEKGKKRPT
jgi:hypothetical protein